MEQTPIISTNSSLPNNLEGLVLPLAEGASYLARALWGNVKTYTPAEVTKTSPLGKRVWMDITLGEDNYKGEWRYVISNNPLKMSNPVAPPLNVLACIVEINGTKEIVKSMPMGGSRAGTVKEYINQGDYIVSIKGILATKDNTYPERDVKILHEYIKAPAAIPVTHELLQMLGIYELVIEGWSFPARPGFENLQAFELNCVSDYPLELEIKNKKSLTK